MNEVVNCKEIIDYVLRKKSPKDGILSKDKRFKILEENRADIEVYKYLKEKLENLKIEVCGDYEGKVLDLMKNRGLEGWCWQTTESSIVFLNNNDYIERGNLVFDQYKKYWHSWINFYYEGIEYTFDPCLDIISKKELYQETGYTVPLDTLISNYELFLKYQEPNFIEQPNFDLEPFFGVESKNSLEINTYAVRSDYRSAGLAKAMLYETLKAMFAIYFENPENNEIYLVSTIHNSNTNSQEVLGAFGIDKYLYVERMKDQNRRVYIHKINKEDLQEFLYEIELEILMEYNYYSENFGIDMLAMKERIEQKIETYAKQLEQASNEKSINYYEAKIGHLTDLLNNEMFQNLQR